MLSRSRQLLNKSIAAMISAVEIYNKPDHKYREETFAVLALNAWELLLKAFYLENHRNNLRALYIYEPRKRRDGELTRRKYVKRNRAGNPLTISLGKTLRCIEAEGMHQFHQAVKDNVDGLMEVRDNAVHFSNQHEGLGKLIQELGTACLQNYVALVRQWFDEDLAEYNFYLMPLAFIRSYDQVAAVNLTSEERKFADLVANLQRQHPSGDGHEFAVLAEMEVRLKRDQATAGVRLAVGDDPDAVPVRLTEEDIRENYPLDYAELTATLRERYVDFKANAYYHEIRRPLKDDRRYVMPRYLDPENLSSSRKEFYSSNVLNVFDRYYTRDTGDRGGDDA